MTWKREDRTIYALDPNTPGEKLWIARINEGHTIGWNPTLKWHGYDSPVTETQLNDIITLMLYASALKAMVERLIERFEDQTDDDIRENWAIDESETADIIAARSLLKELDHGE